MPLRLRLIAGDELAEKLALALQAFLKGEHDGVAHGLDTGRRRLPATQALGQRLGGIGKALGDELVFAVADEPQRPALRHHPAGKSDRGGGQISFNDLIDDPVRQRLGRRDRIAGNDHLHRLLRTDQPRQALSAARARQQAELDLGQADPRSRDGDAEMAGQRQLEAAAQGGAVQCGDDRLRHRLDLGDDLAEARGLRRLAEFGDVGAGEKGPSGAGDHRRPHRLVGFGLP